MDMSSTTTTTSPPVVSDLPTPLAGALEVYSSRLDINVIRKAHDFAVEAHTGQIRASGDEYITHTVEVASILAQLQLDTDTIVAGLVHDTIEDTKTSVDDLRERFGPSVAAIVLSLIHI